MAELFLNVLGFLAILVCFILIVFTPFFVAFLWHGMGFGIADSYKEKANSKPWVVTLLHVGTVIMMIFAFFFIVSVETVLIPVSFWDDGYTAWMWGSKWLGGQ